MTALANLSRTQMPRSASSQRFYSFIFLAFFSIFLAFTKPGPIGWNDASRMSQIHAVVETGSLYIDNSPFKTGDKYHYGGHFYSDKPPLLALVASPVYLVAANLGFAFNTHPRIAYYITTLFTIGVLAALSMVFFARILREFLRANEEWTQVLTFVAGAGTLFLPYSTVFSNHAASGSLLLIGTYYLLDSNLNHRTSSTILAGLLFSAASAIDIGCFIFLPFVFLSCLLSRPRSAVVFALACIPFTAVYFMLNVYTSGSLRPPAMNGPLWDYPGSRFNARNISGSAEHNSTAELLAYGFHMLFGNRGVFSHSPVLLFSFVGLGILLRQERRQYKEQSTTLVLLIAAALAFMLPYIVRSIDFGGTTFAIRWFCSVVLILCIPLRFIEDLVCSSRPWCWVFIGVATLSVLFAIVGAYNPATPDPSGNMFGDPGNSLVTNLQLIFFDSSPWHELKLGQFLLGGSITLYFFHHFFIRNMCKLMRGDGTAGLPFAKVERL
jgi:hypothetical protein